MTKKELKWRLKNLPSVTELETLVAHKIITTEEARDLLFNEQEPAKETDREKELQKQIEFLEDLVKELSKNKSSTVYVNRYVDRWIERCKPYEIWCTTSIMGGGLVAGYNNVSGTNSQSALTSYTQNLLN